MQPRDTDFAGGPTGRTTSQDENILPGIPRDIVRLATDLMDRLCEAGLRVATAESCTGGLLSAVLTGVEGASHAFERGFVVYTDAAKREVLGVPSDMIRAHGAVSAEVAAAMVQGALASSNAHIALAITGFAGPGARNDEEGLVYQACLRRGGGLLSEQQHLGSLGRPAVRKASIRTGLRMLIKAATGEWPDAHANRLSAADNGSRLARRTLSSARVEC